MFGHQCNPSSPGAVTGSFTALYCSLFSECISETSLNLLGGKWGGSSSSISLWILPSRCKCNPERGLRLRRPSCVRKACSPVHFLMTIIVGIWWLSFSAVDLKRLDIFRSSMLRTKPAQNWPRAGFCFVFGQTNAPQACLTCHALCGIVVVKDHIANLLMGLRKPCDGLCNISRELWD